MHIGGIFFRWDYVFLILSVLILANQAAARLAAGERLPVFYPPAALLFFLLVALFSLFQFSSLGAGGLFDGVKYAIWPLKVLIWALLMAALLRTFRCDVDDVYAIIYRLVIILGSMQALELLSPDFRSLLFNLYPVSAEDRLQELTYRARAVFNGYDTASIFFCIAGIAMHQLGPSLHKKRGLAAKSLSVALPFLGAFFAARTGFLLLVLYHIVHFSLSGRGIIRVIFVTVTVLLVVRSLSGADIEGKDIGLLERYVEVLAAVINQDSEGVNSLYGTFYMNQILLSEHWDVIHGAGLTAETTADQLYVKYLYMFGLPGLLLWCIIHGYLIILAYRRSYNAPDQNAQAYSLVVFSSSVLLLVAHVKGGNYLFAQRLGEIIMLLIALSFRTGSVPRLVPVEDPRRGSPKTSSRS